MTSAEKLAVLDGLRAISILLVLATHMLPLGPKPLRINETTGAMGMMTRGARIAVLASANPDK